VSKEVQVEADVLQIGNLKIVKMRSTMGAATLGSVFERYKLNAICNDCGRSKELDVAALKDKYGDDFGVPRLSKMVKCTKCGSPHGCVVHLGNLYDPKMG